MPQIEATAKGMGDAVIHAGAGVPEGAAGHALGIVHFFPGVDIAVVNGRRERREQVFHGAGGEAAREIIDASVGEALNGVRQGVNAGFGGNMGGHGQRDFRVQNRQIRDQSHRLGANFQIVGCKSQYGKRCNFRSGSRGAGNAD